MMSIYWHFVVGTAPVPTPTWAQFSCVAWKKKTGPTSQCRQTNQIEHVRGEGKGGFVMAKTTLPRVTNDGRLGQSGGTRSVNVQQLVVVVGTLRTGQRGHGRFSNCRVQASGPTWYRLRSVAEGVVDH